MSTSGTVGTAVGEFVAAGEPSWTLPLQLCNSDTEKSAKEPVSASAFKVVVRMLRLLNGCSYGCDGAAPSGCVRASGKFDGAGADNSACDARLLWTCEFSWFAAATFCEFISAITS